jgi:hypothetical protein
VRRWITAGIKPVLFTLGVIASILVLNRTYSEPLWKIGLAALGSTVTGFGLAWIRARKSAKKAASDRAVTDSRLAASIWRHQLQRDDPDARARVELIIEWMGGERIADLDPSDPFWKSLHRSRDQVPSKRPVRIGLEWFKWLCSGETRIGLDLAIADIKRDAREMRAAGFSERIVRIACLWQQLKSAVPIFVDGTYRAFFALVPFLRLWKKITK